MKRIPRRGRTCQAGQELSGGLDGMVSIPRRVLDSGLIFHEKTEPVHFGL
jgi:hypothetical protein